MAEDRKLISSFAEIPLEKPSPTEPNKVLSMRAGPILNLAVRSFLLGKLKVTVEQMCTHFRYYFPNAKVKESIKSMQAELARKGVRMKVAPAAKNKGWTAYPKEVQKMIDSAAMAAVHKKNPLDAVALASKIFASGIGRATPEGIISNVFKRAKKGLLPKGIKFTSVPGKRAVRKLTIGALNTGVNNYLKKKGLRSSFSVMNRGANLRGRLPLVRSRFSALKPLQRRLRSLMHARLRTVCMLPAGRTATRRCGPGTPAFR
ncbi:Uncharacterised protein [uncultured archaeon]|nr:Uncharacterised protein [uncultured archaeon]